VEEVNSVEGVNSVARINRDFGGSKQHGTKCSHTSTTLVSTIKHGKKRNGKSSERIK